MGSDGTQLACCDSTTMTTTPMPLGYCCFDNDVCGDHCTERVFCTKRDATCQPDCEAGGQTWCPGAAPSPPPPRTGFCCWDGTDDCGNCDDIVKYHDYCSSSPEACVACRAIN